MDVLHTNPGLFGFPQAIGDVDFYPNPGQWIQPGCWLDELVKNSELNYFCKYVRRSITHGVSSNSFYTVHYQVRVTLVNNFYLYWLYWYASADWRKRTSTTSCGSALYTSTSSAYCWMGSFARILAQFTTRTSWARRKATGV